MHATTVASLGFAILFSVAFVQLWMGQNSWRKTIFWGVLLLGFALRFRYYMETPEVLRAYDVRGHFSYIAFVQEHWSIPQSIAGWEFHQPPLYYFLAAAFADLCTLFSSQISAIDAAGLFALICSWISLAAGLHLVFEAVEHDDLHGFVIISLALAVFPLGLYASTRVTNETLLHAGIFVWFLLLYREWRDPRRCRLYMLAVLSALLFLTKLTGVVFVVLLIFFLCLRRTSVVSRLRLVSSVLLVFVACAGWYPVYRFSTETDTRRMLTLGNAFMHPDMQLPPLRSEHLLTFSPVRVSGVPFNNPWYDGYAREYFWEYAYRSLFFGEFSFSSIPVSSFVIVSSLLLLPFLLYGFVLACARRSHVPWAVIAATLICCVLAYRLLFPFAPNQDMRYVAPVILPLLVLTTLGIRESRGKLPLLGTASAYVWILSMLIFDLLL